MKAFCIIETWILVLVKPCDVLGSPQGRCNLPIQCVDVKKLFWCVPVLRLAIFASVLDLPCLVAWFVPSLHSLATDAPLCYNKLVLFPLRCNTHTRSLVNRVLDGRPAQQQYLALASVRRDVLWLYVLHSPGSWSSSAWMWVPNRWEWWGVGTFDKLGCFLITFRFDNVIQCNSLHEFVLWCDKPSNQTLEHLKRLRYSSIWLDDTSHHEKLYVNLLSWFLPPFCWFWCPASM